MKFRLTTLFLVLLAVCSFGVKAQTSISQRPWQYVATGMPDEWYDSGERSNGWILTDLKI